MRPTIFHTVGTSALIGLLGGAFVGVAGFLWLVVYSILWPNEHLGSTAILGPVMEGVFAVIYGVVIGTIFGAILWAIGIDLKNPVRCGLFGLVLFSILGLFDLIMTLQETNERVSQNIVLFVGLGAVSCFIGGPVGGTLVGTLRTKAITRVAR